MLRRAFPLLLAVVAGSALALLHDELLEPEKAFRISTRPLDERTVEVEFKIAPGYYMYRDRFSFATDSGKTLEEARRLLDKASPVKR